jgi:hypothetical protein
MREYFEFTTPSGEVIRAAFPDDLPLDEREAFIAAAIAAHLPTPTTLPKKR